MTFWSVCSGINFVTINSYLKCVGMNFFESLAVILEQIWKMCGRQSFGDSSTF
jgi:hypothetical protein